MVVLSHSHSYLATRYSHSILVSQNPRQCYMPFVFECEFRFAKYERECEELKGQVILA